MHVTMRNNILQPLALISHHHYTIGNTTFKHFTSRNMKLKQPSSSSPSIRFLVFIFFLFHSSFVSSQNCKKSCGDQILKYPFGSGPGCGDPRFQKYITCNSDQQKLTLTTHTGCYSIDTIDYDNQILYITDPTMSTCSSTHPSKGFGLDWNAPFTFHDDNFFALLDCSTTSSPLYTSKGAAVVNATAVPLCDNQGASVCSLLYSCPEISTLNLPISTCCAYTPVDLGPSFEMDLQKLQCTSYTAIYSFNGQESNPERWKYGVALKYKFNVNNEYPSECSNCEKSNGVCGYTTEASSSFICNCISGINTTTDCYFAASLNDSVRLLPWLMGKWLVGFSFGLLVLLQRNFGDLTLFSYDFH